jgi:hypothetical protein
VIGLDTRRQRANEGFEHQNRDSRLRGNDASTSAGIHRRSGRSLIGDDGTPRASDQKWMPVFGKSDA